MTLILQADNDKQLQHAGRLLKLGGIVAIPTETVYGLAANAADTDAIQQVYQAKNRPQNHPAIVHIGAIEQLQDWAYGIPDEAYLLAEQFWPGPLTLLLHRHPNVSPLITGGSHSIAIRMPNQAQLRKILQQQNIGVIAPSANLHKQLSPTTAAHVLEQLDGKIDAVLDGGRCSVGIESTILDLRETSDKLRILRPGPITAQQLSKVLNQEVEAPEQHDVSVAGNMAKHYQPQAKLRWLNSNTNANANANITEPHSIILVRSLRDDLPQQQQRALGATPEQFAHALYHTLHELDQKRVPTIWLEPLPETHEWQALRNRLHRAAE